MGFSKTQRGIKTDGFQIGKFLICERLGILVPVYFGTRLGVSWAAPKEMSKRDGYQNGKFVEF